MSRNRIDLTLVDRGFFSSREKARAAILANEVKVDGQPVTKAGHMIATDATIEVAEARRFVSRGGHKLEGALVTFGLDVTGVGALDVGSSTGGFTDCLLKRGAASVVAVDVGYGQLAWELRQDPRVTVFERTNIRHVDAETIGAPFELVVIDVSFIGLSKVFPHVIPLVAGTGSVLALVKPQFEAGKGRVGKKGVVRESTVHTSVLGDVVGAVHEAGWQVRGLTWSPIKGPEGNIEFWAWIAQDGGVEIDCGDIVRRAHEALGE
ncbi:MAG: TlyA family RNA methyltransferase [Coriobacteriia bacterium]|nr:TlyA family RNA methyltransferase [Coriobacteriia bacterium]